ncbi:MAG: hypothetical protein ACLGGX_06515 [Bdellovibrionia bacterium]
MSKQQLKLMLKGAYFRLLAIFLTGVISGTAQAEAPRCSNVFSFEYTYGGRIAIDKKVLGVLPAQEYAQAIRAVDQRLGTLSVPHEFDIQVGKGLVFSNMNTSTSTVFVGVKSFSSQPHHADNKINLVTLMHEYGHAVFEKNFLRVNPTYRVLRLKLIEFAELQSRFESDKNLLDKALAEGRSFSELEALQTRFERNIKKSRELAEQVGSLSKIHEAMHEVFADTVAVFITKDPKAMAQIVEKTENGEIQSAYSQLNRRNFAMGKRPGMQKFWEKEVLNLKHDSADGYFVMLPVRWALWDIMRTQMSHPQFEREFLPKLFKVLEKNFNDVVQRGDSAQSGQPYGDILRLNRQIIDDLKREFSP